ncbi:MAG: CocE/NonD family hydrolase [Chloroflexota bacterium]
MPDLIDKGARRALKLPRATTDTIERRKDLPAVMSDGTILLADHYIPDGDDHAPLVLIRNPYGRRGVVGMFARLLAHEGFQVVQQSCRGTGGSGGRFNRPLTQERRDGADTVAWLREQPFYPGSFATYGGSYLGYTQLALPPESKDELFAAVLQFAPSSAGSLVWEGGALALGTSLSWATQASRNPAALIRNVALGRRDGRRLRAAGVTAPLIETYKQVTGGPVGFLEEWWTHPESDDPFWAEQDHLSSVDSYDCPVLVQSGWYDLFLESSLREYERIAERRSDARLTVGPWAHTEGAGIMFTEAVSFLRAAAGPEKPPLERPVRLLDARTGGDSRYRAWPVPVSSEHRYLAPGRLQNNPGDAGSTPTAFRYDPADPTPQWGGRLLEAQHAGRVEQAGIEQRADVVIFDTNPLETSAEYVGSPALDIWASADVPAPQLFIRLSVVDVSGRSYNVTDRLLSIVEPADRGTPIRISAVLPPTSIHVRAGERLRLLIAGGAFPQYARSPGTGESPVTATTFLAANIQIHHDDEHRSRITLPRATLPAEM